MGRRTGWSFAPLSVLLMALSAGGLVGGPGVGESAASPAVAKMINGPAAPDGSANGSTNGSATGSATEQQVETARSRLAVNLAMPHPGRPEDVTAPSRDTPGSGHLSHPIQTQGSTAAQSAPAAVAPAAAGGLPGLDVSGYQGAVNWGQVAANGAKFAYVKATESTSYRNPYFAQQYNGSYGVGLVRGAYHFALPGNSTGAAQADYFVAHGGGWSADGRTLPGMLDIEYNPYGPSCYGLTAPQMVNWIASFDDEYQLLTNRRPDIYTTTDWWVTCTGNSAAFGSETLSIASFRASPYPLPRSWTGYTFWQYANSGIFPGDQEVFNGDRWALVAFATGQPGDRILTGQTLRAGDQISSVNGYRVVMQADGNLVEYDRQGHARWHTRTNRHPGAYTVMQGDGNLVVYLAGRPLWSTGTNHEGPSTAVIQGDGNFVTYTTAGRATWSSRGGRIR